MLLLLLESLTHSLTTVRHWSPPTNIKSTLLHTGFRKYRYLYSIYIPRLTLGEKQATRASRPGRVPYDSTTQ